MVFTVSLFFFTLLTHTYIHPHTETRGPGVEDISTLRTESALGAGINHVCLQFLTAATPGFLSASFTCTVMHSSLTIAIINAAVEVQKCNGSSCLDVFNQAF